MSEDPIRLRDRFFGFATVRMPEGPSSYRVAGQSLRLFTLLALGPVALVLTVLVPVAAIFLIIAAFTAPFGGPPDALGEIVALFGAAVLVALLVGLVVLVAVNHVIVGWARREHWGLWGARLLTAGGILVGGASAARAVESLSQSPEFPGAMAILAVLSAVVFGLTWMEGVRVAFEEGEGAADAALETGG